LNSVLLPAPFGPMIVKIVPGSTSKLTWSTATRPLGWAVYLLISPQDAAGPLPLFGVVLRVTRRLIRQPSEPRK